MKNIRNDITIRRYIDWSKIVRDKPIHIRLYELIYFELLFKWLEMNKPPLHRLIYEIINSDTYEENFIKKIIFQKYIDERFFRKNIYNVLVIITQTQEKY